MHTWKDWVAACLIVVIFAGFVSWFVVSEIRHADKLSAERYSHEGIVTAVSRGESSSYIFLDTEEKPVRVRAANLDVTIGFTYHIITDGNGSIISIEIVKQ